MAYKVDLKSFNDQAYRSLGGTLGRVTETIKDLHRRGLWVEVVTLLIPGFNDSETELRALAGFLASVSRDIPWHVTAFHPDYHMTEPERTAAEGLLRAAAIGREAGLRFVYAGNLPGQVGSWEHTHCPGCGAVVVERYGFLVQSYQLTGEGKCPHCQTRLPGIWPTGGAAEVRTGKGMAAYYQRLPRPVR